MKYYKNVFIMLYHVVSCTFSILIQIHFDISSSRFLNFNMMKPWKQRVEAGAPATAAGATGAAGAPGGAGSEMS